jgi:hypothetical protein
MSLKPILSTSSNMKRYHRQITVFTVLSILFIISLLIVFYNQQIIEYYAKH